MTVVFYLATVSYGTYKKGRGSPTITNKKAAPERAAFTGTRTTTS